MNPALIFAWGNASRGDDALGPLFLERMASVIMASAWPGWFDLQQDFQLQVEHALEVQGRELVLFVDASRDGPEPFSFRRVLPAPAVGITTHHTAPGVLLRVYREVLGESPPPAWVLGIRGHEFELGEPLTPRASDNLESALGFAGLLIDHPDPAAWDALCCEAVGAALLTA